jgi:hypothetical protein
MDKVLVHENSSENFKDLRTFTDKNEVFLKTPGTWSLCDSRARASAKYPGIPEHPESLL